MNTELATIDQTLQPIGHPITPQFQQPSISSLLPNLEQYEMMWKLADVYAKSGMYQSERGVYTQAQCFTILQTGLDLGLSPSQSMLSIHNIKGKPSISADLMTGICLRSSSICPYIHPTVISATKVTYITHRTGAPGEVEISFTIEEAIKAGYTSKSGPWQTDPTAMLIARCKTRLCKAVYADLTKGLTSVEEMNDTYPTETVNVTDTANRLKTRIETGRATEKARATEHKQTENVADGQNRPLTDEEISAEVAILRNKTGLTTAASFREFNAEIGADKSTVEGRALIFIKLQDRLKQVEEERDRQALEREIVEREAEDMEKKGEENKEERW